MSGTKVFIIDNITFVCMNAERFEVAGNFMKKVITLKKKYELTIIALSHTPKRYNNSPLSQYDLAGSARLINLFDAGIAIGCSALWKNVRYIKQVKTRTGDKLYDEDNVLVCELTKNGGWLHFEIVERESEYRHLSVPKDKLEKGELMTRAVPLVQRGYSVRKVEKELEISHGTTQRLIKEIKEKYGVPPVPGVPDVSADTLGTGDTPDTLDMGDMPDMDDD